jgi:hypothetical protein
MTEIVVRSPSGTLPSLALHGMEERFDDEALEGGARHAVRGDVSALTWDAARAALTGTVRGAAGREAPGAHVEGGTRSGADAPARREEPEARVLVQFTPVPCGDGLEYELTGSICTCGTGSDCAHASGVLHAFDLAARDLGPGADGSWERLEGAASGRMGP